MISPNSRYAQIDIGTLETTRNGLPFEIRYLRRRFIPSSAGQVTFAKHTVRQGDRVDNITAKYLTDPTLFWKVCDANNVFRPEDLTATLGQSIAIALPLLGGSGK
jgi:hypothetical protein